MFRWCAAKAAKILGLGNTVAFHEKFVGQLTLELLKWIPGGSTVPPIFVT